MTSWVIPVPEKPLNLEIDPLLTNENQIGLRWDEPEQLQPENGPITGYRILWRIKGDRNFNLHQINIQDRSVLI